MPRAGRAEGIALAYDATGEAGEIFARVVPRNLGDQRGVFAFGHLIDDLGPQQIGGAVFDLGELRADLCLQREAAQKGRAERVDGLNFQPAGRLDRAGKKGAGIAQLLGRQFALNAKIGQGAAQCRVFQHGPFAQAFEQAVLHLRGRRLGIGQAKDVLRLHVVEQQPRHAVGQHAGLARARIGGQPSGGIGPRRFDLGAGGIVEITHHSRSSGRAGLVPSHSPNRASWSKFPAKASLCTIRRAVKPCPSSR